MIGSFRPTLGGRKLPRSPLAPTNMKPLLLFMCCTLLCACNSHDDQLSSFIAPLKPRVHNLYTTEFVAQQAEYDKACGEIGVSQASTKPFARLASVFVKEARVTGDHPYYYPAALRVIEKGLSIDGKSGELLLLKTSVLLSLHRFEEARVLASELSTSMPDVATIYGMLCDANLELGRMKEAVHAVDVMMSLRPGLESYARVSYLRERHGDTSGALQAMRMAVQAGLPGSEDAAWARITYGNLLLKSNNIKAAEQQYQLARLERPNYAFAIAGLARIEHLNKHDDVAIAMLDSALAMVPEVSFVGIAIEIETSRNNMQRVSELKRQQAQMIQEDRDAGMLAESRLR